MNDDGPDPLQVGPDGLTADGLTLWEAQCLMLDVLRVSLPEGQRLTMHQLGHLLGCTHQNIDSIYRDALAAMREARAGVPRKRKRRQSSGKVLPDEALRLTYPWEVAA